MAASGLEPWPGSAHAAAFPGALLPRADGASALGSRGSGVELGVGQKSWDPILVGEFTTQLGGDFSGDLDVHWAYGILTHGQLKFWGPFWTGVTFVGLRP